MGWIVFWLGGIGLCRPIVEQEARACLSLSPFRAVPGLGVGLSPERTRDQVLTDLGTSNDSGFFARLAGTCPENVPILDVFQDPGDLIVSGTGTSIRFRLEWHHVPGETEFYLTVPKRQTLPVSQISSQLHAVAEQMLARVELRSQPDSVSVRIFSEGRELGGPQSTPVVVKTPPGVFSVQFSRNGLMRRKDTLLVAGGIYEFQADFRSTKVNSGISGSTPPDPLPWWTATGISFALTLWLASRQNQAEAEYHALAATDPAERFESRWRDLRDANILRNTGIGLTLALGGSSAWIQWIRPR